MTKTRQVKAEDLAEIKSKLASVQSAFLTDFRGLNVEEVTDLRRKLHENNVDFKVVKNTLVSIAAREVGLHGLEPYLQGPTAIAYGVDDPAVAAKGLMDFIKNRKKLEVKAGILNGRIITPEDVKVLADLPPRPELLAKLAGCMQSPMVGFARVLQAQLRSFVFAVAALQRQKEAAG